jgi:hypothetical protein
MPQLTDAERRIVNEALATYRGRLSVQFREAKEDGNELRTKAFEQAIRDTQTAQRKLSH